MAVIYLYTLFIFNNESNRLERYNLEAYHNMPYTTHNSLSVFEFFNDSISKIGWSTSSFLSKWSLLSKGKLSATRFFRRTFEGGSIAQSMHYAGIAADVDTPIEQPYFPFRENNHVSLHPFGYPNVSFGASGIYVLILQDCLMTLGLYGNDIDGFFGNKTLRALLEFKKQLSLSATLICDAESWYHITNLVTGIGITNTITHTLNNTGLNNV